VLGDPSPIQPAGRTTNRWSGRRESVPQERVHM